MIETNRFDIVKYLDSDEAIAIYLTQIAETGDSNDFIVALGDVARAKGIAEIAQKTGLARESIYKALTSGSKPRFDTIMRIMNALNLKPQYAINLS
ncbi:putative addiction module antidote protein [Glaesserella parasuis]|uniref:addiction module antidote protein n=1 Tax=Glaesserella parasuis TaxID=738 RepID=UPI0003AC47A5|nr:addiction module antidote protein [Glaesserella parasuis]EQA05304.1 helix-turn-helix family protein [Glaesserella parasuis 12939]MCT8553445.1 putative addiction module antidote protein [Glaesserella parasuis]MCT8566534.1 putative addiction module antidote protein [Glaesserella parasuis]MCT8663881.1 putative addiction module antidote protein [Glaesserella parasuis]MCT8680144.1 putative addiction module antidote protein [Glaesserella parasuis]